ncbi:cytochrome P450 [Streptomyces viridiviolaceus]|uniref:Cytochrome P450 n=1 Tax=Streptomyces viridiviolaceus TaxID=68282 RepID=A0ABW2EAV2_9ACTN|nr:cytochrome P450 [Streptomyces viridiviolaceus]GHB78417.1 cytochrome P450 [Streptomyces viridiviolaceus]
MSTPGIVDLTALGEDFVRDPYPFYARLRERGPVHRVRTPEAAEAWLVVGYEAARTALVHPGLVKSWARAAPSLDVVRPAAGPNMLNSDGTDHGRLRKLVAREFTPRRVAALVPAVEDVTRTLLDTMASRPEGRADLVADLAFPLSMSVICDLLGVPFLDQAAFRAWTTDVFSHPDPAGRKAASQAMGGYLAGLLEAKRKESGVDLMSALIRATDEDGDRLSADELLGTAWLLLVAGHETTANLLSNGVLALLRHPAQLRALREDMTLLPDAVEEMLRYDGPVEAATFRFTTDPVDLGGAVIPGGGQLVMVVVADANRDPARFPDSDRFDIRRPPQGHIAFGYGVHYCLGAPLARLEVKTAVRQLLRRFPRLALDIAPAELSWKPGMLVRGPRRLPVRWT